MTAAALFVGAGFVVALFSCGLACVGLAYVFRMDAPGRSESGRSRRECRKCGECSRPAEPDRDALARVFRATGWIDMDTVRRYSR